VQNTASENKRSFGPDLIRATAITLVLLSHTFPGGVQFPILGAVRSCWGVWGVEIFFTLSGYLIGGILINQLHEGHLNSLGDVFSFWKRRWFRTLPNYYLFLFLTLFGALYDCGRFPNGWEKYLWFGQALFSKYQGFYLLAWSLAIEEWFYLLFPLFLLAFAKLLTRHERAILATIIVFLVVPPFLRYLLKLESYEWDIGARLVTLPRLDAIAYGVCLALIKYRHSALWNMLIKCWPIGIMAVAVMFAHASHTFFVAGFDGTSVGYRVLYFCLISVSIALLFPRIAIMTAPENWWATIIRKLSLWSYSIYLSHIFFIWLISEGFTLLHWQIVPGSKLIVLSDFLDWLLTIPGSALIYKYFEKPCMDLRDRKKKVHS